MRGSTRHFLWRLLPAVCFAAAVFAWSWLYLRFLRSFYSIPNPFIVPLSLMQWLPGFIAAILALARVRREEGSRARAWFFLALALTLWPLADGLEQLIPSTLYRLSWLPRRGWSTSWPTASRSWRSFFSRPSRKSASAGCAS